MKWIVRTVLVIALMVQGWQAWTLTAYDRAFRQGVRAYNRGEVDEVRDRFREAMAIRDDDPLLWAWLGDASLFVYDWQGTDRIDPVMGKELLDEAWAAYAGSVARCPSYAWSWGGLAGCADRRAALRAESEGIDLASMVKVAEGIWDPTRAIAVSAASIALELKPSGFNELDLLADIHLSAGNVERAKECFVRSARIMPAPSFHTWGTHRTFYGPLYEEIMQAIEEGLSIAPSFEWCTLHLEVGRFAFLYSKFDEALKHFEIALEHARDDYWRHRVLWEQSRVYQEIGDYENAIRAIRGSIETGYVSQATYRRLAALWRLMGDDEEVCAALQRAIQEGNVEAGLRIQAATACDEAGDYLSAQRVLEDGLVVPTDNLELARALLSLYVRNGRLHTARNTLDLWRRDHPDQEEFHRWAEGPDFRR